MAQPVQLDGARLSGPLPPDLVLAHDLGPHLRKGAYLATLSMESLRPHRVIHAVRLGAGDVHEDDAAIRLGAAVAGDNVAATAPRQSQVRLQATARGVLRVDAARLRRLNRLAAVSVFTLPSGQTVETAAEVAGCKVTPVAVRRAVVERAEAIAAAGPSLVKVEAFRPLRTVVLVTERLGEKSRQLFREVASRKLGWFGARQLGFEELPRSERELLRAYEAALDQGAQLVLIAGASALDPLDPALQALSGVGGRVLRAGLPAHPGSMIWIATAGEATFIGVASCAGFGRDTALDLVLPEVFARGDIGAAELADLGHGGLVEKSAGRTFPPYAGSARVSASPRPSRSARPRR